MSKHKKYLIPLFWTMLCLVLMLHFSVEHCEYSPMLSNAMYLMFRKFDTTFFRCEDLGV